MRTLSGLAKSSKVAPVIPESDHPSDHPAVPNGGVSRGGNAVSALVIATSPPTVTRPESRVGKRFLRYDNSWKGGVGRASSNPTPAVILETDGEGKSN